MAAVSLLRPMPFAACRAAGGSRSSTMAAAQRLQQRRQQVQQRRWVRLAAGRGGGPDRDSDSDRCAGAAQAAWGGVGLVMGSCTAGSSAGRRLGTCAEVAAWQQLTGVALPAPRAPRSEDFFMTQEGNSIDEAYFEEEEMSMEDDDSMRLYLDSADVQVGGRAGQTWVAGWQYFGATLGCTLLPDLPGHNNTHSFCTTLWHVQEWTKWAEAGLFFGELPRCKGCGAHSVVVAVAPALV